MNRFFEKLICIHNMKKEQLSVMCFHIETNSLSWIDGIEESSLDKCLHGMVIVTISDETIEYPCTVSATGLRLLKSIYEDHIIGERGEQMLPCCGHFLIPNDTLDEVIISGCDNGIDFGIIHKGSFVEIISESGSKAIVSINEYVKEVIAFVDTIQNYYLHSKEKIFDDSFAQNGYTAFWNEWHKKRTMASSFNQ